MPACLATFTIPNRDAIAKDGVVYQFVFADDPTSGTVQTAMESWFTDFFTHDYGTGRISSYLSHCNDLANCELKLYDINGHLDGSPHGSPVFSAGVDFSGFAATDGSDANQAALVLGYHDAGYAAEPAEGPVDSIPTPESAQDMGAPATHMGVTKPRARHGGRIYFGPMSLDCVAFDANKNPQWSAAVISAFGASAGNGKAGGSNDHALHWSQWSRRDSALNLITAGWVDHSVRTRRLRAFITNTRSTF